MKYFSGYFSKIIIASSQVLFRFSCSFMLIVVSKKEIRTFIGSFKADGNSVKPEKEERKIERCL